MAGRLLVIDDDARLSGMVRDYLGRAGFMVEARATGMAGVDALIGGPDANQFDAVILDIMLPDMDGLKVCRRIREHSNVPILMLTARGEDTDRIVGLELGADDYLAKPFNPRELQARIAAVLRRARGSAADAATLRFGRLEIDIGARVARVDGEARTLTAHQFDLLVAMARHAGRVLSRERLLDLVNGEGSDAFDRSIDVHVSKIRAAIEDEPAHPRRIITVRGAGYVFARVQDQN